jgi:hypothetical protein
VKGNSKFVRLEDIKAANRKRLRSHGLPQAPPQVTTPQPPRHVTTQSAPAHVTTQSSCYSIIFNCFIWLNYETFCFLSYVLDDAGHISRTRLMVSDVFQASHNVRRVIT